ncbi:hypothetical protein HPB49_011646 [Dermacentor silvarum]|uniref:Uncharacterized protein n=1 Tax=Dermacentor silvarum TaxID=543639 RepID=A0ACB8D4M3_DERSI|nr:hypothetical protein HPB49_011646 [Dermacentor silvarum]
MSSLSSTSASKRKMRTLATAREDSDPSAATYMIVDLSAINRLLERTNCRTCRGAVSIKNGARDYGIAVKLCLECSNCGTVASEWSSRRTPGAAKCTPFEVNILAARAMQSIGNGQAALNDVFSIMGISHRGLHHKSYQSHLKNKLNPAATRAAGKVLSDCAMAVQKLYRELYFDSPGSLSSEAADMENGFLNPRANTAFEEKFGCPSFVAFWMEAPATFPHLLVDKADKQMLYVIVT